MGSIKLTCFFAVCYHIVFVTISTLFYRFFMSFVSSNIFLIGLAIISAGMLLWPSLKLAKGGISISSNEAVMMINRQNAIVLDVQEEAEFANGHISDAKHIPFSELDRRLKELNRFKTKPVIVNCQTGMYSPKACELLRKNNFTQIHNLQGGLNAWTQAKLPTVKANHG